MDPTLYYYEPITPPPTGTVGNFPGSAGSRTASGGSSVYTDSPPETVRTNITTPNRSPAYRQRGPTLLPKIRPQDIVVEPVSRSGPYRHRRAVSNLSTPGFAPYPNTRPSTQRSVMDPIDYSLLSPVSPVFYGNHAGSALTSPVTPAPPQQSSAQSHGRGPGHSRSTSTVSINEPRPDLYATHYQPPRYVIDCSPTTPISAGGFHYPTSYGTNSCRSRQQDVSPGQPFVFSDSSLRTLRDCPPPIEITPDPSTTSLLRYLTAPTQAIHLVHNASCPMPRMGQTYFWWDVRNLRRWSSFSLDTINSVPNLTKLLTTDIPDHLTPPSAVNPSRLSPESETGLARVIRDIYTPHVNAALRISQGRNCLALHPAPDAASNQETGPHFLANYATDTEMTASGYPRGRVVGIVKSFDRWNTGMRNEQPHRRVEYLNGLAHLQHCMREHSCRYGFIMTEIELVCVRAGCDEGDDVPYFGYLELAAPIATKTSSKTCNPVHGSIPLSRSHSSSSEQSSDYSASSRGSSPYCYSSPPELSAPFTATLALYYLLMLAKSVPLPGQPCWHLNVGGPGALTRQRILPDGKDKWIPEPQQREKRDAKRVRGWIMPQDEWHRREGGGASRSKASKAQTKKRWHK